jgi:hypothetical protein
MHPAVVNSPQGSIFFWNVDAPVGLNGKNKFDDVLFVQWCFYKLGQWDKTPPELRATLRNTNVNGECSGRDGDPLIASIKALQQRFRNMVDGRVSPAGKQVQYSYHNAEHTFIIFRLNAALRVLHPTQYPRIDLMPDFIWRIKDIATAPFI